ncbi:DUF961 family protein [Enterococcus wangshanyuanii]|uniref:DUF961 domain-containing protein n=1 Tax=Enterococcus wangshanyuanii TaxID=2005703 RepID=A0ABQ1PD44_9ENTE|nr:DUF961 family protein [Enterococcus wangshanyuanii]GGC94888.1 hypothetical protein GCM10011573_25660 [Enterococcus wangshanyuanii]
MSSIKVEGNDITPLIDFEKTFGKLTFLEQIADQESRGEDGERGEVKAVRFEVLSENQGAEFRVKIDLEENPLIDLSKFEMDDEIELVEPKVFERNMNNGSMPNMVVTIEAIDVKKKGVTKPTQQTGGTETKK